MAAEQSFQVPPYLDERAMCSLVPDMVCPIRGEIVTLYETERDPDLSSQAADHDAQAMHLLLAAHDGQVERTGDAVSCTEAADRCPTPLPRRIGGTALAPTQRPQLL